jgi:hypothetical protein
MFGTTSLHKIQLNFTMEQLSLTLGRVDCSIWLADQLWLQDNDIFVGIVPYAHGTLF